MNANDALRNEQAQRVLGWLQRFSPEAHALTMERLAAKGKEAPPEVGLEGMGQMITSPWHLGQAWLEPRALGQPWREPRALGQMFDPWGMPSLPPAAGSPGDPWATAPAAPAEKPWWREALETAGQAATAVFAIKAQKDMLDINVERAKAGLPPIPTEATAPTIKHVVDIPQEYKQEAARLGRGAQQALLWGGLGLAAILAFTFLNR